MKPITYVMFSTKLGVACSQFGINCGALHVRLSIFKNINICACKARNIISHVWTLNLRGHIRGRIRGVREGRKSQAAMPISGTSGRTLGCFQLRSQNFASPRARCGDSEQIRVNITALQKMFLAELRPLSWHSGAQSHLGEGKGSRSSYHEGRHCRQRCHLRPASRGFGIQDIVTPVDRGRLFLQPHVEWWWCECLSEKAASTWRRFWQDEFRLRRALGWWLFSAIQGWPLHFLEALDAETRRRSGRAQRPRRPLRRRCHRGRLCRLEASARPAQAAVGANAGSKREETQGAHSSEDVASHGQRTRDNISRRIAIDCKIGCL